MRAARVLSTTGPDGIEVRDVPEPVAGPEEVLVEVHRVGVSFPDLALRDLAARRVLGKAVVKVRD